MLALEPRAGQLDSLWGPARRACAREGLLHGAWCLRLTPPLPVRLAVLLLTVTVLFLSLTHSQGLSQAAQAQPLCCQSSPTARSAPTAPSKGPGGNVLDRPVTIPGIDLTRVYEKERQRPRMFRVMLHNDNFNKREFVVKVLIKTIPGMTVEDAICVMQEAHVNGLACVISCGQEDAEEYCNKLRSYGLKSTMEPAGGGGSSNNGGPEAC